jgi:hypothetical protein
VQGFLLHDIARPKDPNTRQRPQAGRTSMPEMTRDLSRSVDAPCVSW